MLRRFEAELRLPDGARAPSSMGSTLHGALIEQLPEDYRRLPAHREPAPL